MLLYPTLDELNVLSLLDVIVLLTNPEFDEITKDVHSNYEFDNKGLFTLFNN